MIRDLLENAFMSRTDKYIFGILSAGRSDQYERAYFESPEKLSFLQQRLGELLDQYARNELSPNLKAVMDSRIRQLPMLQSLANDHHLLVTFISQQPNAISLTSPLARFPWMATSFVIFVMLMWPVLLNHHETIPGVKSVASLPTAEPVAEIKKKPVNQRTFITVVLLPTVLRKETAIPQVKKTNKGVIQANLIVHEKGVYKVSVLSNQGSVLQKSVIKSRLLRNQIFLQINLQEIGIGRYKLLAIGKDTYSYELQIK